MSSVKGSGQVQRTVSEPLPKLGSNRKRIGEGVAREAVSGDDVEISETVESGCPGTISELMEVQSRSRRISGENPFCNCILAVVALSKEKTCRIKHRACILKFARPCRHVRERTHGLFMAV
jgi:hypothetical protein